MKDIEKTLTFVSPDERKDVKELEQKVKSLQDKLTLAERDIKKLMTKDYEVLCDFCIHKDSCYTLASGNCRTKARWRYDEV